MLTPTEYMMGIRSTQAFIDADAEQIVFSRPSSKTSDGEGGFLLGEPVPYGPLKVRLIPQSDQVPEISTSDGISARPVYVLLAMPFEDIQRYDRFIHKGTTYEIAQIHDGPEYELKGDAVVCG